MPLPMNPALSALKAQKPPFDPNQGGIDPNMVPDSSQEGPGLAQEPPNQVGMAMPPSQGLVVPQGPGASMGGYGGHTMGIGTPQVGGLAALQGLKGYRPY